VLQDEPSALGILLEYEPGPQRRTTIAMRRPAPRDGSLRVAVVGAGNFARGTLVPALQEADAAIAAVCARSGAGAKALADKVGAATVTTDWRSVVASADIDAVVIATPHAEHADMAVAALEAGKAVFVEKPLAVSWDGLARVALAAAGGGLLLVGHNRRFAPLVRRLRDAAGAPAAISIRVAAGPLPHGHWLEDPEQGGRILGEISHFVDLAAWLGGGVPERVFATTVPVNEREESLVATLALRGGSAATIVYGVGPAAGLAKERIEVLGAAGAATLDDFARLELHGAEHETVKGHRDKGHGAQIAAWAAAARGEAPPPVPVEEQLLVAAASLALLDSARTGAAVDVRLPG
jgi:predicted dehydrogenase